MNNNNKKGQAAMEFLMTYGWAILAAIVVIAVLAIYFRPSSLVSTGTAVTAPWYASSQSIKSNVIQIELKDNGGEVLNVTGFNVTSFRNPTGAYCTFNSTALLNLVVNPGASIILQTSPCAGLTSGDTMSADVIVQYRKQGSTLDQVSSGTISGKVL